MLGTGALPFSAVGTRSHASDTDSSSAPSDERRAEDEQRQTLLHHGRDLELRYDESWCASARGWCRGADDEFGPVLFRSNFSYHCLVLGLALLLHTTAATLWRDPGLRRRRRSGSSEATCPAPHT